jgi:aerobic-type carbon monoxide dehydrogenase small subunit (CoxS/CutS family)
MISFTLNAKRVSVETESATPLLWIIRDQRRAMQ